ncbi:acyl-CoA reductase [Formosa sp. S-31]|uniref:acyl-CoA reductase n=1 Tax=Formosa sp. S-31 TaxID=2790949 RepID=UPI003EB6A775
MNLQQRIAAFVHLGKFLSQFSNEKIEKKDGILFNDLFFDTFKHQLKLAQEHNGWFNQDNLLFATESWANALTENNINTWLEKYNFNTENPKTIAVIMAGNIPLVGFHDFLSVLISGHNALVKQSSNDKHLLPFLAKYLEYTAPEFKGRISFTDQKLEGFDAVIATGSDNTARYFEYYFKNKPAIIRKNRNSIAVLTGKESPEELEGLADDIFRYYGLGCRSVSKLYLPENYNFDAFFQAMYKWNHIIHDLKYANNYDYNKAVYLMSEFDMLENGFLMIKEDQNFSSPIATVFYQYYNDIVDLKSTLNEQKEKIQCVVSKGFTDNEIVFGDTQSPNLWDYADNVDTVDFLLKV